MQTELKQKIATVQSVTHQVYEEMPDRFSALNFCNEVRSRLHKPTMDGTILRRLRELREDGRCPYKVVDSVNSIYKKGA